MRIAQIQIKGRWDNEVTINTRCDRPVSKHSKATVGKNQRTANKTAKKAWELANRAASLLKTEFCATQVVVFGSLVHEDNFTLWSDVDIAAWGMSPEDTFRAMDTVRQLSQEIEVNLVVIETCKLEFLMKINREGVIL